MFIIGQGLNMSMIHPIEQWNSLNNEGNGGMNDVLNTTTKANIFTANFTFPN